MRERARARAPPFPIGFMTGPRVASAALRPTRHLAIVLLVLTLATAALAQAPSAPTLWLDAASGGLRDLSGNGNDATLEGHAALAGGVFALDGNRSFLSTATQLRAPQNGTILVTFRTTTPGGKLAGFESLRNASSPFFDRQVWLDDAGRAHAGVWIGRPLEVASATPLADGAWHAVAGEFETNATGTRVALVVDGALVNATSDPTRLSSYSGWWRFGAGSFQNWVAPRNASFTGDISEARIYADALPASALPLASPPASSPPRPDVTAPQATAPQVAGAVATAVVVAGGAAVAASRSVDLVAFARKLVLGAAADKWKDRTKHLYRLALPSLAAAALGVALMAVLTALGKPGALRASALLDAFLLAVAATVLFKAVTLAGGALLSRLAGEQPRYHLWTAGTLTLALTSVLFHAPFGYTGYMEKAAARPGRSRAANAVRALATLGLSAGVALAFLVAAAASVKLAQLGVAMALSAVGAAAMPFPQLAGNALWAWRKWAGALAAIVGFVPYALFELGRLPIEAIWSVAVGGLALFAVGVAAEMRLARASERA